MSVKETVTGIVTEIKPSTSSNPKAPKGYIYVNEKRLTIWEEEIWDSVEKDKSYSFICSLQDSEYNGKKYTNRNVVSGMPDEPLEEVELPLLGYKVVIDDKVEIIHLPKEIVDYLKEKLE